MHDVVTDRTITMLNLNRDTYSEKTTLRSVSSASDKNVTPISVLGGQAPSAFLMEIRSESSACAAVDFLAENGVDLQHICDDGRTAPHIATEMASYSETLKHLHVYIFCMKSID